MSSLNLVSAGYLVYIFPVVVFPSAAPSRIFTSRSDVTTTEMRNGRRQSAQGFKLLCWKTGKVLSFSQTAPYKLSLIIIFSLK